MAAEDSAHPPHPPLERIRETLHRLLIDAPDTSLRKEDEQKCRELAGLLGRLTRLKKGAHVVDAAAGKASVGMVAAELLPLGTVTIIEREAARVAAACTAAKKRLRRDVHIDIRHGDVADPRLWPERPDAVVALHACGVATDLVIRGAIASGAAWIFVAPCCYDASVLSRARAYTGVPPWLDAADEPIRRRILSALVDTERALRLEAAGFETRVEEFVAPTITPHNLVLCARRTACESRMARASRRLATLLVDP